MKFNNLSSKACTENCYAMKQFHSAVVMIHIRASFKCTGNEAGLVFHIRQENLQLEAVNRFIIIGTLAGTSNNFFTSYPKIIDCRCCCDRRQTSIWPKKSLKSTSLSIDMLDDEWRHQKYVHKIKSYPTEALNSFENFIFIEKIQEEKPSLHLLKVKFSQHKRRLSLLLLS